MIAHASTVTVSGEVMIQKKGITEEAMASYSTTTPTPTTPSSRWNPTQEQLLALEELYKKGMRTPSAEQIQQIALELLKFGKIEGKNVFYWFQNHKARERQKRRREGEDQIMIYDESKGIQDKRDSGLRGSVHGKLEQSKHLVACSRSKRNTKGVVEKAIMSVPIQQKRSSLDKWPSGCLPSSCIPNASKLFSLRGLHHCSNAPENKAEEIQTLQLFPLCEGSNDEHDGLVKNSKKDKEASFRNINTPFRKGQFFEFLPLKN